MKQVTDTGAIEAALDEIIAANPAQVEKAKVNPETGGLVRGSGDESDRWQGQPQSCQPDRQCQAGALKFRNHVARRVFRALPGMHQL